MNRYKILLVVLIILTVALIIAGMVKHDSCYLLLSLIIIKLTDMKISISI